MKPLKFQAEDLDRIDKFKGRALVTWDPGLGKTYISLWWLGRHRDVSLPAVIVCPASVKWQWARAAEELLGIEAIVLEGQSARLGKLTRGQTVAKLSRAKLVISNYDILRHWEATLAKLPTQTYVFDECQYTKNPETQWTKVCQRLCRGKPHVIGLSATPMLNNPIEMFPILQMIRPKLFRSRWDYAQEFCKPRLMPWGWAFGVSNTRRLHELLTKSCMIRRKKTEVFDQFPPKVRSVIVLPMKDPNEYRRADAEFIKWLAEKDLAKAKRARKAEALTKVGYLLRTSARLKMRYVVEWVNKFLEESDEKLIVFAIHERAIESLNRNIKCKSVVIQGRTSAKKRLDAVDQFRSDSKTRVIVGNLRAAGVGVDGLQIARNVVFAELPWQPGLVLQGEDRAWRIGTKGKVWIRYFVAEGTIEEKLCKTLQRKQNNMTAILDGRKAKSDLDVLDKLLSQLRKGVQK